MMQCFLCLEAKEDTLDCMQIKTSTWEELKVEGIILKHLWSSIMIKPKSQWFCLMCWNQLQYFHNFYVCIENAQNTLENNFPISHENSTIQTEYKSKTEGEYNNHGTSLVSVSMNGAVPTSINIVKVEVEFLSDNELEERYNSSRHENIDDNCDDTMNYTDPPAIEKELTSVDDTDYVKSEAHSPKFPEGDSTIQTEYESQKEGECKHNGTSLISVLIKGAVPTNINMVKEEVELISDNELEQRYNSSRHETIDDNCDDTMNYTDPPAIDKELSSVDDADYVKSEANSPKFTEGDSTIQTEYESQNEGECKHNGTSLVSVSMDGASQTGINIEKEEVEFISDNELEQRYNSSLDGTIDDNYDDTMDYTDTPVIDEELTSDDDTDCVTSQTHSPKSPEGDPTDIISTTYYYQFKLRFRFHDILLTKHIPMECSICMTPFDKFNDLKHHSMEIHDKSAVIVCCDTEFDSRRLLVDHICYHLNPKYFKCEFCPKVLTNRKAFQSHTRHHEKGQYTTCHICNLKFYKQCYMDYHKLTHVESKDKHIPCKECGVFFANEVQLARHMKTDHSIEMCKICGESFHTSKALLLHLNQHDIPMRCNCCGFMVLNKFKLNTHFIKKHTLKNGPKSYICQVCNRVSVSANGLKTHVQRNHTTGLQHKCVLCYKTFKSIDNLQIHLNTHGDLEEKEVHQPEDKNFACLECNQCFSSEFLLSAHVKRVHVEKKCQICEEVLPDIKALERHMEEHVPNGTRICPICNTESITTSALKRHIHRYHQSCSLHKCPRCNKSFKRKDTLQRHMNSKGGCNYYLLHRRSCQVKKKAEEIIEEQIELTPNLAVQTVNQL